MPDATGNRKTDKIKVEENADAEDTGPLGPPRLGFPKLRFAVARASRGKEGRAVGALPLNAVFAPLRKYATIAVG